MDPINRGPEDHGHDGDGGMPRQRPPRDSLAPDFAPSTPAVVRTVQVVSGEFLLTVNPVDGSEIEPCPPAERPGRPEKLTEADRVDADRAARPPVPPGPAQPALPLLERQDDREQLVRLLARGRSVRLTGPSGAGRTALLDLVADDCSDLAPDGVVRLSGFRHTVDDVLRDLFHAVHRAPQHRPDHDELLGLVREIGAVVVLDDLEFGGAALDELLDATPECAFLFGATPDVPAPAADSGVEEVVLDGLERAAGIDLLERAAGRVLTEEESNWAGDLWFESEGLPLRFVQAGALLRQRDQLRVSRGAVDEFGVFQDEIPADAAFDAVDGEEVPLPSLGEAAAPAPLLAARLSASARATLRFAVALGGEVPHQAHLPALVGDTHADAALGELAACGLVSPVGARYRLAAGVLTQLEAAGYADDLADRALTAAQHYTWWAGHPSVTPERVSAEAEAVLAALGALVPLTGPVEEGESPAVLLARAAAPAFAAGLRWSAWERALRAGAEAAQLAGDVAEQVYFHHELGILALCEGQLDRARAELEASIGLRGALADKRGTVAGRRALALVGDRAGDLPGFGATAGEEVPDAHQDESASPAGGTPVGDTLVSRRVAVVKPQGGVGGGGGGIRRAARRNLVAAGSGALLVAVLGTVVGLGMTSHDSADHTPSENLNVNPSVSQGADDGGDSVDTTKKDDKGDTGTATSRPTDPGPDGTFGTSDDPTPPAEPDHPSDAPSGTTSPRGNTPGKPTTSPSGRPPTSKPPTQSPSDEPPSGSPSSPSASPSDSPTSETPSSPATSNSASGPATSASASAGSTTATPTNTVI
ncbi:ATP-binding protein [Streptomyces sp. NPDC026672]|uniref:ATP-binding protein n=1 Tax=unclassified Streptomyces TaxID=2593676 RepID=UPI0033ECCEFB